jgi:molybdate transport system substrate-binding protein
MFRRPAFVIALATLAALSSQAVAGQVRVAVAANFLEPAQAIAAAFKSKTGNTVELSPGSTGQLYTQLTHGAPYEIFLSADVDHAKQAEADGLARSGSRFTYAIGRLVLYSSRPDLVDNRGAVLAKGGFAKLAMADPATAPYGAAAEQTLSKLGVYEEVKSKRVLGTSITQAFQFVETGAADLGFVAQSQVIHRKGGSRWLVPQTNHAPIAQQAVLLKSAQQNPTANAFMTFLKSQEARAIIAGYGYQAP